MTVMRWPDKRTSGRYVYSNGDYWTWQCDLGHDEDGTEETSWGSALTMPEAFAAALAHAAVCPFTNEAEDN